MILSAMELHRILCHGKKNTKIIRKTLLSMFMKSSNRLENWKIFFTDLKTKDLGLYEW